MGRHSSDDDEDEPEVVPVLAENPASTVVAPAAAHVSDLRLVLQTRRMMIWIGLVVLVVFGAYTGVMVAIGKQHDWLIFLFAPFAVTGIGAGALLDNAHSKLVATPATAGDAVAPDVSDVPEVPEPLPTDMLPTDVLPTDVAPTDVVITDALPTVAGPPLEPAAGQEPLVEDPVIEEIPLETERVSGWRRLAGRANPGSRADR
jgi:hypothetical protein